MSDPQPRSLAARWQAVDPRWIVIAILVSYLVMGFTLLGFNRTPLQALVTTTSAMLMEVALCRLFRGRWIFPLSAVITSVSLSILLNYSHDYALLLIPVFFAIGSKYVFTFEGRHVYNPALAGVTLTLITAGSLITAAPSYQWVGIAGMGGLVAGLGMFVLVPKVGRLPLVLSFLFFFTIQCAIRGWITRHLIPFETLFIGTVTSPAFFLFTFFMMTDPATSPKDPKKQVFTGFAVAALDLWFHTRMSYHTFFYAGFTYQTGRLVYLHAHKAWTRGGAGYVREALLGDRYLLRPLTLGAVGVLGAMGYSSAWSVDTRLAEGIRFEEIPAEITRIEAPFGDALVRIDPRLHHLAKYLMSIGDAAATADFDGDGHADLFLTHPLKDDAHRASLYRGLGGFRFERVDVPALTLATTPLEERGSSAFPIFVDYDNDDDLDLFLSFAFGRTTLLQNQLSQTGKATWVDVSEASGVAGYSISPTATFLDVNRDGRLDLFVGELMRHHLEGYDPPERFSIYDLPEPAYEGDHRMFRFMPDSWHTVTNGGLNRLLLQQPDGTFEAQDADAWGLGGNRWTMAVAAADFDQDGWTDLYLANDFGADQLLYNQQGTGFAEQKGRFFGEIGRDTYKSMNASVADFDRNGFLDVSVSNVHQELQAEGSMLWMMYPPETQGEWPEVYDEATARRALNEERFGWGAAAVDVDNDGWVDMVQANGMLDDHMDGDRQQETCGDYWYYNEKVARALPSQFVRADYWGDMRGLCLLGDEPNRVYVNDGTGNFVDVAALVGLPHATNSRGVVRFDPDGDGRQDLLITNQYRPGIVLQNLSDEAHWLGLQLVGDGERCNRMAIGSRVEVVAGADEPPRVQDVQLASGFGAQGDARLHFGLGTHGGRVQVQVDWCGLGEQTYEVEPDGYRVIEMGTGIRAAAGGAVVPG